MACNIYTTVKRPGVSKLHIRAVIKTTLSKLGEPDLDVSVHCVGNTKMRTLNRIFRGSDRPTDVLSFPTEDKIHGEISEDAGDIFLCTAYIRSQAKRFDVTFQEEIDRMLVHGVLHLRGYDHVTKKQANKMFTLQESVLEVIH
jgi:probable rRNA maturation factor